MSDQQGSRLHHRILLGLIIGAVLGSLVNRFAKELNASSWLPWLLKYVLDPLGQIFMRLLILTVVPLVFTSLAVGVARLGDFGQLGRIGAKTFAYFIVTTGFAVTIGLVLVNFFKPGVGLPEETRTQLLERYKGDAEKKLEKPAEFDIDTFVNMVPRNPLKAAVEVDMLAVIFVALLTGIAITRMEPKRGQLLTDFFEAVGDVTVFIIHLAMRIAPYGVFALIFGTTARFGFDLLRQLGMFVFVVLLGLSIQMFVVFPLLVKFAGGRDPIDFFRKVRSIILTAFSTSSSNATLPTSIRITQEELKVPAPIAGFVLPLGATMNMNGTALFEGVTAVFLAQVFGIDLTILQQCVIVALCVLTAVGAAGVPGGSIPLLAGIVLVQIQVPPAAIAIILGVDRILDMCRTTLNVIGDVTAALFIARTEKSLPSLADPSAESASDSRL